METELAVVGCGALGRLVAAAAAAAGIRVAITCTRRGRLDGPLELAHKGGIMRARVRPMTRLEDALSSRLIVAAVRSDMIESIADKLTGGAVLYTQPTPLLERFLGRRGSGLLAFYGCSWLDRNSGRVEYEAATVRISLTGVEEADKIQHRLVEGFELLGLGAQLVGEDRTLGLLWDYVAAHASTQPVATVLGVTYQRLRSSKYALSLVESLAREVMLIVDEKGVAKMRSPVDAAHEMMSVRGCKPKMQRDLEEGRNTEIDYINGLVVREALRHGLYAPYNDSLYLQVKALEDLLTAT